MGRLGGVDIGMRKRGGLQEFKRGRVSIPGREGDILYKNLGRPISVACA